MQHKLKAALRRIKTTAGPDFSGIGLIVTSDVKELPIFPLRENSNPGHAMDDEEFLARISVNQNAYHDGFHVVTHEIKILRLAQYFSPPIIQTLSIDRRKLFGGRYLAALFGSCIPNIILTGIASNGFGIALFEKGEEVFYEGAV